MYPETKELEMKDYKIDLTGCSDKKWAVKEVINVLSNHWGSSLDAKKVVYKENIQCLFIYVDCKKITSLDYHENLHGYFSSSSNTEISLHEFIDLYRTEKIYLKPIPKLIAVRVEVSTPELKPYMILNIEDDENRFSHMIGGRILGVK